MTSDYLQTAILNLPSLNEITIKNKPRKNNKTTHKKNQTINKNNHLILLFFEGAITEQKTLTIYSKPNNYSANQVSWQHTELPCFCLLCPYNTGI
ncbi:TPA: hypothetical protein ACHLA6_005309, partial [Escherichia coli]